MDGQTLRVAIDVTVTPESAGGVAQVILGLVRALGQLEDSSTLYKLVVASQAEQDFLKSHLGNNQQFAFKTQSFAKRLQKKISRGGNTVARRLLGGDTSAPTSLPPSDGFFESLECDVVHFPHQRFVRTNLPAVYNPHDLQHRHFPEFFGEAELVARDLLYRSGCEFADTVTVSSRWIKEDVIEQYQLDPDKVQIIPWAPPTEAYEDPSAVDVERVKRQYNIPDEFAIYPAMTWPHKNHLRLLEALAFLRDTNGTIVNLVCTGSLLEPHASKVKSMVEELGLTEQVRFLGFVPDIDLRCIYRLAQFLVMPSLFESDSSPIYEAWLEGTPIACSNVTSLPVQVMDAAILFDPYDHSAIAKAIDRLSTDQALRRSLAELGHLRVKDYDWERTAKAYRAVYRRAGGCSLTEEDRWLLSWDWMEKPMRLEGAQV
jgi:glycosyltransferase involved in cell wall biosynthesis